MAANDGSDGSFDDYDSECMDHLRQLDLKKLRWTRKNSPALDYANLDSDQKGFFEKLYPFINDWKGKIPDLRDIFRKEDIDLLLMACVNRGTNRNHGQRFIKFVIETGYRDEPDVDESGKPSTRLTTALHFASRRIPAIYDTEIHDLFKIYDRFNVNYANEHGLTHLHVACMYGLDDVVEKFLELGQDPDCLAQTFIHSPLHMSLQNNRNKKVVESLLRNGANPNLVGARGFTPLHMISMGIHDNGFAELFFKINDEKHQTVLVDAQDNEGRTPLQLAVARFLPNAVDALLDHGADLSKFSFPTDSYFGENTYNPNSELKLVSGALAVVERLEKRGYELNQSDVLTIVKLFVARQVFTKSIDLLKYLLSDNEIANKSKNRMVTSNLSLYDVIRLRPEEAAKRLTYTDYYKYAYSNHGPPYCIVYSIADELFAAHLNETMARGFCRRLALDSFLELTHYCLPILCCEIIVDKLANQDLCRIFLAATGQNGIVERYKTAAAHEKNHKYKNLNPTLM